MKVRGPVVNADLSPTILDITGEPKLPQDGISLLRVARNPARVDDRGVLLETFKNPRGAPAYTAIRTKRYRYEEWATGEEGLYDLALDPWELQSVHNDPRYARIKGILAAALAKLRNCQGAGCRVNVGELPAPGS